MKKVLLVVGNGFDLNLQIRTSYIDFINSIILENNTDSGVSSRKINSDNSIERVCSFDGNFQIDKENCIIRVKNNTLIRQLKLNVECENWVDIEFTLGELAKNDFIHKPQIDITRNSTLLNVRNVFSEYEELKLLLKKYLVIQYKKFTSDLFPIDIFYNRHIQVDKFNDYNKFIGFRLLCNLVMDKNINLTILNFNYTYSVIDCCEFIFKYYNLEKNEYVKFYDRKNLENNIPTNHHFTHSHLQNRIVFGIDDKETVSNKYVYLHKSYYNETTTKNINQLLVDNKEIIFFGYSLGKTDASYFDEFFKRACIYNELNDRDKKKIIFYYYKNQGYKDLFFRLIELTEHNTAKLKQYNNIKFIDVLDKHTHYELGY
jgi:hypothetical protein